jgi:hypothetical protein
MDMKILRRSQQALSADVGSDVVALNIAKGACYGMEKVAADVWQLLAQPTDIEAICKSLGGRYEVDPETCRADVGRLIDEMVREGLVEVAG